MCCLLLCHHRNSRRKADLRSFCNLIVAIISVIEYCKAYLDIKVFARMEVHDVYIEIIISTCGKELPQCKDFSRNRQDWLISCLSILK